MWERMAEALAAVGGGGGFAVGFGVWVGDGGSIGLSVGAVWLDGSEWVGAGD